MTDNVFQINVLVEGKVWGDLVAQYSVGRRVACRCRCQRLVMIAAEELASGALTSCGCGVPSHLWLTQQRNLIAEMKRVINFNIARGAPK